MYKKSSDKNLDFRGFHSYTYADITTTFTYFRLHSLMGRFVVLFLHTQRRRNLTGTILASTF